MKSLLNSTLIFVILLFISLNWVIFWGGIYEEMNIDIEKYGWTPYVSILILLLVFTRGKLLFNSRNRGKDGEKLPKLIYIILILTAIILLLFPPVLSFLNK
ncbi:hypothetical protein NSQ95_08160 [Psychrobacillus sp. FSL W7-1457]|uniref:hypothetical protein n=1 Tax=unclassified Psychrobacillus TaxID=2636677 RepID=UPI0030F5CC50